MAYLETGERTYVKPVEIYGTKQRSFLGISNSAVITCDDGSLRGYAGNDANVNLVSAVTKKDGLNQDIEIPTDFRTAGIAALSAAGIAPALQITMFTKFMTEYTKEQRDAYVAIYDALDKNDASAVAAFVSQMVSLLS